MTAKTKRNPTASLFLAERARHEDLALAIGDELEKRITLGGEIANEAAESAVENVKDILRELLAEELSPMIEKAVEMGIAKALAKMKVQP